MHGFTDKVHIYNMYNIIIIIPADKTAPTDVRPLILKTVLPYMLGTITLLIIMIIIIILLIICSCRLHAVRRANIKLLNKDSDRLDKTIDTLRAQLCQESCTEVKLRILDLMKELLKRKPPQVVTDGDDSPDGSYEEEVPDEVVLKFTDVTKEILMLGLNNPRMKERLSSEVVTAMKACNCQI